MENAYAALSDPTTVSFLVNKLVERSTPEMAPWLIMVLMTLGFLAVIVFMFFFLKKINPASTQETMTRLLKDQASEHTKLLMEQAERHNQQIQVITNRHLEVIETHLDRSTDVIRQNTEAFGMVTQSLDGFRSLVSTMPEEIRNVVVAGMEASSHSHAGGRAGK